MPRKATIRKQPRTLENVRADIEEIVATIAPLRAEMQRLSSIIRAARFRLYVTEDGKRKRNPVLKDSREVSATLKSYRDYLANLNAEEQSLLKTVADSGTDQWSEFAPKKEQKTA
jgi:hypothetical protein